MGARRAGVGADAPCCPTQGEPRGQIVNTGAKRGIVNPVQKRSARGTSTEFRCRLGLRPEWTSHSALRARGSSTTRKNGCWWLPCVDGSPGGGHILFVGSQRLVSNLAQTPSAAGAISGHALPCQQFCSPSPVCTTLQRRPSTLIPRWLHTIVAQLWSFPFHYWGPRPGEIDL